MTKPPTQLTIGLKLYYPIHISKKKTKTLLKFSEFIVVHQPKNAVFLGGNFFSLYHLPSLMITCPYWWGLSLYSSPRGRPRWIAKHHWQRPTSCWWARWGCPTTVGLDDSCRPAAGKHALVTKKCIRKHVKNQQNETSIKGHPPFFGTRKII